MEAITLFVGVLGFWMRSTGFPTLRCRPLQASQATIFEPGALQPELHKLVRRLAVSENVGS